MTLRAGMALRSIRRASSVNVDSRGVAVITLNHGKVNMMDRTLMPGKEYISLVFTNIFNYRQLFRCDLESLVDDGAKGFIIRSDIKNVFCAGLDIRELHQKPTEDMIDFWHLLQDSWHTLYSLKQPMIAAVNGAAIAGGCLIACCADTRIMINNPKTRIDLAPMLGMVTPTFVMSTFETIVGRREAELALGLAKLYSPQEAHHAGLIDILVETDDELLERANAEMDRYLKVPAGARSITKSLIRGPLISNFEATRDENTKSGIAQLQDPDTQEIMAKYLSKLGGKK